MSATGLEIFDKTLQTTNCWLKELADDLGPDRHRCYRALRAVLFALRDRLTPDQAAHLAAQMPLLVRGIFYEGYKPAGKPCRIRTRDEFLQKVGEHLDYMRPINTETAARAVLRLLDRHIARGELEEVKQALPHDIRTLFPAEPEPRTRVNTFEGMYVTELQELANAEEQLGQALSGMAAMAASPALKNILADHRRKVDVQKQRLVSILEKHGAKPNAHSDQAMDALLKETRKMMTILQGDELCDAGLIASIQKLKHYEMAAYGTAAALAGQLGRREEQRALHECLDEERAMDRALTELAKGGINQHALAA